MAQVSLPTRFFSGTFTDVESQVYTVQSGEIDVLTSATLCNLTDVAHSATIKLAGTEFIKDLDLAPRQVIVFDFKQVINAGESIAIQADEDATVSLFLSGVQITEI